MKSTLIRLSLLALALAAGLPGTSRAETTAERQKELETARAELQRAAKRVAELSRELGTLEVPLRIERRIEHRPVLGVLLAPDDTAGVRITGVTPDSGAAKAGLKAGDQLLKIGGKSIAGADGGARLDSARTALAKLEAGTPVTIAYRRDGRTQEAKVTPEAGRPVMAFMRTDAIGDGPGAGAVAIRSDEDGRFVFRDTLPPIDLHLGIAPGIRAELQRVEDLRDCENDDCGLPMLAEAFRWSGLNLASVDAQLGRYFGAESGVLVLSTGAELEGLQAGDVIRKVEGKPVASPREVMAALRGKPEESQVEVEILRDRQTRTARILLPKALPLRVPLPLEFGVAMPTLPELPFSAEMPMKHESRMPRVMVLDPEGRAYEIDAPEPTASPVPPKPPAPATPPKQPY